MAGHGADVQVQAERGRASRMSAPSYRREAQAAEAAAGCGVGRRQAAGDAGEQRLSAAEPSRGRHHKIERAQTRDIRVRLRGAAALSSTLFALGGAFSALAGAPREEAFASPERAAEALGAAWHSGQASGIAGDFRPRGPETGELGDPVAERNARQRFAASYDEGHRIERAADGEAILVIGNENWPYPGISIVKHGAAWQFDVKAGAEEVLDRRIGRNELHAIQVARAYVEAQRDYAAKDRIGDGLHEYAQQVASTAGKHDGLYWAAAAGEDESPLGPLVATAETKGYAAPPATAGGRSPLEGYYFRILTAQGAQAPGGAKSYVVNGHMTAGFALVAYPAKWGNCGCDDLRRQSERNRVPEEPRPQDRKRRTADHDL